MHSSVPKKWARARPHLHLCTQRSKRVKNVHTNYWYIILLHGPHVKGNIRQTQPPHLTPFLKQHPSINLEIVIEPSLVGIVTQGFDAGVLYEEHLAQDMIALSLGPFRTLHGRAYYGDSALN
jgi:hypothetical protein